MNAESSDQTEDDEGRSWWWYVAPVVAIGCICSCCWGFLFEVNRLERGTYVSRAMQSREVGAEHWGELRDDDPAKLEGWKDVRIRYDGGQTLEIVYRGETVSRQLDPRPMWRWDSHMIGYVGRTALLQTFDLAGGPVPVGPLTLESVVLRVQRDHAGPSPPRLVGEAEIAGKRREVTWLFDVPEGK